MALKPLCHWVLKTVLHQLAISFVKQIGAVCPRLPRTGFGNASQGAPPECPELVSGADWSDLPRTAPDSSRQRFAKMSCRLPRTWVLYSKANGGQEPSPP